MYEPCRRRRPPLHSQAVLGHPSLWDERFTAQLTPGEGVPDGIRWEERGWGRTGNLPRAEAQLQHKLRKASVGLG